MSFGGGFGGFGQNNNTQQSGFGAGGFGSNNNTTNTGTTGNTGFGGTNTGGGGLFGGSGTTGTTGAFGSGVWRISGLSLSFSPSALSNSLTAIMDHSDDTSEGNFSGIFSAAKTRHEQKLTLRKTGFGNNAANNAFGAKPGGFGAAASSGGLFGGSNTATAGGSGFGGGFGATNTATTSSPFGGGNTTGGGLFGQSKPAFGAAPATSSPFGGGATSSPFGGGATTGAFGTPASTALASAGIGECQGTGSVPFQAFVEKEPNSNTNQQNSYQSICFQAPYAKFSPEELRLADYAQGRRYGNGNNQTGAFGATNFGGFGAQPAASTGFGAAQPANTNVFGGGASTGFGTSQPASTGFGNTATSGGLFGAKPATGGLFGSTPAATNTGGLFGAQPAAQQSGGLFGAAQPAAQPAGGLFGNSTATKSPFSFGSSQPAATGTGFGTSTTGGFGGSGSGLFGNTNTQSNNTTGFGGAAQPAAASSTGFGGFGGNNAQSSGGLFGASNQPKPATGGLFGSTPAATNTGGLFGNTQPAANANPFGGSTATQSTGGLFGNKPATTGGLFGGAQPANTSGGSLFGGGFGNTQNQPQQQNTGGLFGTANNNQPKPGGLFGNTGSQQQNGGGLFGNTSTQQSGGLFGASVNNAQPQQQQPQNSLFGGGNSIFNPAQPNQQNAQSLTASINDNTAFGSPSLFSALASTQINNPGPLATPLSSSTRTKKNAALPMYKLNSTSTSRFSTPQKRPGFGFSYSNYNSPSSVSSTSSTPGAFGASLLSTGGFGRNLNKSMSTSSLRRNFNAEDSILAPGAFSASSSNRHFGSTGSVKKLTISRGLRQDLFSPPETSPAQNGLQGIMKKKVSFGTDVNGAGTSSPLKQSSSFGSTSDADAVNGGKQIGTSSPEMEQVSNPSTQLTRLREEQAAPAKPNTNGDEQDVELGDYWMKPSREEIENMPREQRQAFIGFTVGRKGCGHIVFEKPVDLTSINIDAIFGDIVLWELRRATVYPDAAKKPPVGKGLNVYSTIYLENSWPRGKHVLDPKALKKHINRLKNVTDTKFVNYDKDTGVWSFTVDHYTTYGFPEEDDEDETDAVSEFAQSTLSAPPDTPTPKVRTPKSANLDQSFASDSQMTHTESDPEDTFQFRKKKVLPGAFDDQEFCDDESMNGGYDEPSQEDSFLDERSVGSQSENGVEEPMDQDDVFRDDESVSIVDEEMASSHSGADNTAELKTSQVENQHTEIAMETPGTVLRARQRALKASETPLKRKFAAGDDWADTLQATVSPKKQDRALLKSLIDTQADDQAHDSAPTPMPRRVVSDGRGFANGMELHNSLFPKMRSPVKVPNIPAKPKGFEWPYVKRSKTGDHDMSNMEEIERAFHDSLKPQWSFDGTLVYAAPADAKSFGRSSRRARERDGLLTIQKGGIVSEHRDIRFAKFSNEASAVLLKRHKDMAQFDENNGIPFAHLPNGFSFSDFFDDRDASNPAAAHEKLVWQLASVLFDRFEAPENLRQIPHIDQRLLKDRLSAFWQNLVDDSTSKHVALAKSKEEKAIAFLSGHKIPEACGQLVSSGDFHLATLVALIGSRDSMRKDIREQLENWQKTQMLSEFSQPIRAVYELLAGNVCICAGSKGDNPSFVISKRFGLDWRQAFGLRLWYCISSKDPIDAAVEAFATDLAQDKETTVPHAWYVEQKIPTLWNDERFQQRQDLLWGLLKLYTFSDSNIEDILRPENSQLSPLDTRLSWQLGRALTSAEHLEFADQTGEMSDRMTLDFAAQLTNEGSWLDAVFVMLHLSSDDARAKTIQNHLAHHAGFIGSEDDQSFVTLTQKFRIPTAWIWEAKALYMRSVERDPTGEVKCLVKAGSFNEAHRTFAREVAPKAIVELDYDTLRDLLHGFQGRETTITEWHLGGEIYRDFLEFLYSDKKGYAIDELLIERLLSGLPAVVQDARHPSFMETVAIETISAVVAKSVVAIGKKAEKANLHKVLRLPLTEDKYLKHTVDLSLVYYRGLMASAR
ncbi:nucleoporin SONB [Diplocarpon rosae]|nr:nucleoporin SONB [Diplocarpon rosae]